MRRDKSSERVGKNLEFKRTCFGDQRSAWNVMSSRGQANSSRSKKPRDKKASQVRDHSHDSNRSDTEQSNTRIKSKDDGRRKDASRSRASRSPRKTRDNKEQINIEKASSTRNLLGRKDDVKSRSENAAQDKGRETSKSPVYGLCNYCICWKYSFRSLMILFGDRIDQCFWIPSLVATKAVAHFKVIRILPTLQGFVCRWKKMTSIVGCCHWKIMIFLVHLNWFRFFTFYSLLFIILAVVLLW